MTVMKARSRTSAVSDGAAQSCAAGCGAKTARASPCTVRCSTPTRRSSTTRPATRCAAVGTTAKRKLAGDLSGKTKTERAEVIGKEIARLAKEKGIETVVFDRGSYKYHGRVKALADAAREGGLKF